MTRKHRAETIVRELPPEPEAGAPDVAEVVLRAQGSGKRFTRRFLKTETVSVLYKFVRTLPDDELAFDDPNADF